MKLNTSNIIEQINKITAHLTNTNRLRTNAWSDGKISISVFCGEYNRISYQVELDNLAHFSTYSLPRAIQYLEETTLFKATFYSGDTNLQQYIFAPDRQTAINYCIQLAKQFNNVFTNELDFIQ